MNKQLVFISLILLYAFNASAQRRMMDPTKMAEKQTAAIQERFTEKGFALSEETLENVKALHLKYAQKSKTLREENKGDRTAMREAMEGMDTDKRKEMKKLLTKEQFKEYKKLEEEQNAKRQERMNKGPRGGF